MVILRSNPSEVSVIQYINPLPDDSSPQWSVTVSALQRHRPLRHEEQINFLFLRHDLIADLIHVFQKCKVLADEAGLRVWLDSFKLGYDSITSALIPTYEGPSASSILHALNGIFMLWMLYLPTKYTRGRTVWRQNCFRVLSPIPLVAPTPNMISCVSKAHRVSRTYQRHQLIQEEDCIIWHSMP